MERIEITQDHIDTGTVRDVFRCAIALAFGQELAYEIRVANLILIGKDYYQVMPEVARWIADFDRGRAVEPITIELVPYEFAKKTYRMKGRQPIYLCGEAHVARS